MHKTRTLSICFFSVVLIVGSLLRFYHISSYDLWFDELGSKTFSYQNIKKAAQIQDVSESNFFFKKVKEDPHSFLYFIIVYFYTYLFNNPFSLRILASIFSILSLIILYKLSRSLFDEETGLYAALILALNPFHIWYAQEARSYSISCFMSLSMIYLFFKALKTDDKKDWFFFGLISFLSVFLSYYSALLFLSVGFMMLITNNYKKFLKWVYCLVPILLLITFFYSTLSSQISFVENNFWLSRPSVKSLIRTAMVFSVGYGGTWQQLWGGATLFLILFLIGLISAHKENAAKTWMLASLLFIPICFIYIISKIFVPVYLNRQLIILSPYYYMFIAKGISTIPSKTKKLSVIFLICLFLLSVLFSYYFKNTDNQTKINLMEGAFYKHNYADTINTLNKKYKKGDAIIVTGIQAYQILYFNILEEEKISLDDFYFLFIPRYIHFSKFTQRYLKIADTFKPWDSEMIYYMKPFDDFSPTPKPLDNNISDRKRFWVISSKSHRRITSVKNTTVIREHFESTYKKILTQEQGYFIRLDLYEKTPI